MSKTESKKLTFISWLRVLAVFCIFMCHWFQFNLNPNLHPLCNVFNIGIPFFVAISGFLFGHSRVDITSIDDIKVWYLKRFKRIFIPLWIWLFIFWILAKIIGKSQVFPPKSLLFLSCGLNYFIFDVEGAAHTWFITAIVLCYILTPLLSALLKRQQKWAHLGFYYILLCVIGYSVIKLFLYPISTVLSVPFFYAIAFYVGYKYQSMTITKRTGIIAFFVIALCGLARFVAWTMIDGSKIYDNYLAGFTYYVASIASLIFFAAFFQNIKLPRTLEYLETISYEFYLGHFMFLHEPMDIRFVSQSQVVCFLLYLCLTIISALIIRWLSLMVYRYIGRKEKKIV